MNAAPPSRIASAGGVPAGMPARLWDVAKRRAGGTVPGWVRAAPDAGATAPPRIGQIARRAVQAAAAAGVVAGGIGAAEVASRLASPADGAPGADHASTHAGTGSPAGPELHSGPPPGPPGSASEGEVTLHTSGDGGHLASGLTTTWRVPGHGAAGGHGEAGVAGHDGLTVEMYQDVVVHEGTDGMFSVDAVEYVVVRDTHGHAYVFRENYHTVVPDPPGQETDLVVHETDRAQIVEHPDGSFSVVQADNSISVTAGSDGDGQPAVTVTQTESVRIGHDPHADGHDTTSLTESEQGATASDQSEVVTEQTVSPTAGAYQSPASMPQPPIAGLTISSTASGAASSQVGTAFAGLHGKPAEPGNAASPAGHFPNEPIPAGHFPNEPIPAQHPAGGAFGSPSSPRASGSFQHPTAAGAPGSDPDHGAALAGQDQPGLAESGAHADVDLAVGPAEPGSSADADSVSEHDEASAAHLDSPEDPASAPLGHDPGTDTTVLH